MPSFGETLRRERELRQISLREISEATKINLRYLDALERNDFRHLPGGVFNKGFVKAYAQYIGVDADGMVDAYLVEERAQAEKAAAQKPPEVLRRAAAAEREEADRERSRSRRLWLVAAVVLAVLAILAVVAFLAFVAPGGGASEKAPAATEGRG